MGHKCVKLFTQKVIFFVKKCFFQSWVFGFQMRTFEDFPSRGGEGSDFQRKKKMTSFIYPPLNFGVSYKADIFNWHKDQDYEDFFNT